MLMGDAALALLGTTELNRRAAFDRMGSEFETPPGLMVTRGWMAGVAIEQLTPTVRERRVVLHVAIEGESQRALAGRIALACRARSVVPACRQAPLGVDDLLAVYRALLDHGTPAEQIIVVGDSGGGDLVIAMMARARDAGLPRPRALVLLSPGTSRAELVGLPPTLIQVGDRELLLRDAEHLFEQAQAAGVEVELEAYANLWHVWDPCAAMLPDAIEAIDRIAAFVDDRFALQSLRIAG